ncbi:hypothetical protein [Archangium minus]
MTGLRFQATVADQNGATDAASRVLARSTARYIASVAAAFSEATEE